MWTTKEDLMRTFKHRWLRQYAGKPDGWMFFGGRRLAEVRARIESLPDPPTQSDLDSIGYGSWSNPGPCEVCAESDKRPVYWIGEGYESSAICASCMKTALAELRKADGDGRGEKNAEALALGISEPASPAKTPTSPVQRAHGDDFKAGIKAALKHGDDL